MTFGARSTTFKRCEFFFLLYFTSFLTKGIAQTNLILADSENRHPVENTFIFIHQTNYNVISTRDGKFQIDPDVSRDELLNISHLNYEFAELPFSTLSDGDTIFLERTSHELSNINVVAKSSGKRKRWLEEFKNEFLGINAIRHRAKVLNPEVLLFKEDGADLIATADLPLTIRNEKLGYEIKYWLDRYVSTTDGLVSYNGKYFIRDISNQTGKKKDIEKLRKEVYLNSLEYLLKSMIDETYEENFTVTLGRLTHEGTVELLRKLNVNQNLRAVEDLDLYVLDFKGVLNIEHLNVKAKVVRRNLKGAQGLGQRAEIDMIQHDQNTTTGVKKYESSFLFSRSGRIVFDSEGKVQNTADIREYGYWGTLGMADVLPAQKLNRSSSGSVEKTTDKLSVLLALLYPDEAAQKVSLAYLDQNWEPGFVAPLLDLLLLSGNRGTKKQIADLLGEKTGEKFGLNYYQWLQWIWKQPYEKTDYYANFKAELYRNIDNVFESYFRDRDSGSKIRLDEVVWGGVKQDGIPPLRSPEMIFADQASYLADSDIVFGIEINGDVRAYPRRILAWHEFFTDEIGGEKIAGVYCTLCGTVIAYNMLYDEVFHDLGTSGFLYRSNKLMYDAATQSLWNTIEGKPVIGPLSKEDIELVTYPIVTSTWGEWKKAHPGTLVLSLNTGHRRDYSEGAAYRDYYATDQLMFPVPKNDTRLQNKDEVLVLRAEGYKEDPVALSVAYLQQNKLVKTSIGDQSFVIVTDKDGPSRVYESQDMKFTSYENGLLKDSEGHTWKVSEAALLKSGGDQLGRVPAHRIFWFAWFNAHPETRLVK